MKIYTRFQQKKRENPYWRSFLRLVTTFRFTSSNSNLFRRLSWIILLNNRYKNGYIWMERMHKQRSLKNALIFSLLLVIPSFPGIPSLILNLLFFSDRIVN